MKKQRYIADVDTTSGLPQRTINILNNNFRTLESIASEPLMLEDRAEQEGMSSVAFSGKYSDLTGKPDLGSFVTEDELATVALTGDYDDLGDKPSLAAVATSGNYNDLLNKPTIPPGVQVDSALSGTSTNPVQNKVIKSALDSKANSSSLAAVATSGSYNDLSDKPTIPPGAQVDDALSGTSVNPVQNKVIKSALDAKANSSSLAAVATSGSYNDLSNKPSFSTVATSGSYADLSNKPTGSSLLDALSTGTGVPTDDSYMIAESNTTAGVFIKKKASVIWSYIKSKADSVYAAISHSHAAGDVTSGTFADARIPSLAASKITSGTFDSARIPSLAASKITSGVLDTDRVPNMPERYAALNGGTALSSTDNLDNVKDVGTYYVSGTSVPQNAPTGFTVGKVVVDIPHGLATSTIRGQHYIAYGSGREAYRKYESGSWSEWQYEAPRTYSTLHANRFLATPNGSAGASSYRAIMDEDLPTPLAPATYNVKSLISQTTTQAGNFSITSATLCVSGYTACLDINFTVSSALTANTEYSLCSLATSIAPSLRCMANVTDFTWGACIVPRTCYIRPSAAVSAGTTARHFQSTYILANYYTG